MSKLNIQQMLCETELKTKKYSVCLKIAPNGGEEVEIQFGHYRPSKQVASAADLRELASIFVEVAELLEGGEKAQEKVAKPEKGRREVHVKLSTRTEDSTLHGVFSGLTDKQVEALEHAIRVMNAALPWGMRLWVQD